MTMDEMLAKLDEPPTPMMVEACQTYFRDQAELLAHREAHPDDKWVAYHGCQRIGFGKSQRGLFAQCIRQGIPGAEVAVIGIDASVKPVMEATLS